MNKQLRVHTGRRREAIDLLRSLTTGAVLAGTAGTVGFGILAAATFTGKSTTAATSNGSQSVVDQRQTTGGTSTTRNGSTGTVSDPQTGVTSQGLSAVPTPRPTSGRQSHASTGGSG